MRLFAILIIFFQAIATSAQEGMHEFEELARGYQNQGKTAQAAEFYSKAGYAYWNRDSKLQAVDAFQKAYDLFNAQANQNASLTVANNIGLIYLDLEKYSNSYTAFSNSLLHARKLQNSSEIFNTLINLGSVAIELGKYSDAISKANEALALATEMNNIRGLARSYGLLAESYEKTGDASNAYKYYDLYSTVDKKIKSQELESFKNMSEEEIRKANEGKRVTEIELKIKKGELKVTQDSLSMTERLAFERQMQLELRNVQLKEKEVELRYEKHIKTILIGGIVIVLLFLFGLGFLLRLKLRDNKILKFQKEEITLQRNKLDEQNKKITDSIHYGLRIQQAMLPTENRFNEKLDTFILYRPKDIVSGDFYWYYSATVTDVTYRFIVVADCTGHGVPGAFMSMIGHRLLTEIIVDRKIYDPAIILEEINIALRKDLYQDSKHSMDGMDIALCRISIVKNEYDNMVFAGAKRNILLAQSNSNAIKVIEGDHKTIGGPNFSKASQFTNKTLPIFKGDQIYLFTDGIIDQHNYNRDRFGTVRFIEVIKGNVGRPMASQKEALVSVFDIFKGSEEQRDDITVFAARLI